MIYGPIKIQAGYVHLPINAEIDHVREKKKSANRLPHARTPRWRARFLIGEIRQQTTKALAIRIPHPIPFTIDPGLERSCFHKLGPASTQYLRRLYSLSSFFLVWAYFFLFCQFPFWASGFSGTNIRGGGISLSIEIN